MENTNPTEPTIIDMDKLTPLERQALENGEIPANLQHAIVKEKGLTEQGEALLAKKDGDALDLTAIPQSSFENLSPKARSDIMAHLATLDHADNHVTELTESVKQLQSTEDKPIEDADLTGAEMHICLRCGHSNENDPIEITDEDKQQWLRATLGMQEFEKEYPILGGRVIITIRTRSLRANELVYDQLSLETKDGRIPSDNPTMYFSNYQYRSLQLNLLASFGGLSTVDFKVPPIDSDRAKELYTEFNSATDTILKAAHTELMGSWNSQIYMVVLNKFQHFEQLCARLAEVTSSPDFWDQTALPT